MQILQKNIVCLYPHSVHPFSLVATYLYLLEQSQGKRPWNSRFFLSEHPCFNLTSAVINTDLIFESFFDESIKVGSQKTLALCSVCAHFP